MPFGLTWRRILVADAAAASVAAGIAAAVIERGDRADAFAGGTLFGTLLELAAGWALAAAGLVLVGRRRHSRTGVLMALGGIAWFLPEWSSPSAGGAVVFTIGLAALAACSPVVAHAALAYPRGRVSAVARPALAGLYVASVGLLGVLTAAAFDPQAEGCLACPHNLMLVHGEPGVAEAATRWGLRLGLVSAVTVAGVLTWRAASAARLTSATTAAAPAAAAAYLALVAVELEHSLHRNFLSNDPFDIRVSHWEAATLVALAGGVALGLRRARRARSAVAKLVIEDAASPAAGQVRDALAQALGDPTLRLAYRRDAGDYVDTHGRPADIAPNEGQAATPLLRQRNPIAVLVHDARLLDRPGVLEDAVAAARLAVENERLEAEVRAQLEDLRRSRVRIVETADATRRRLERDLHDGAQQTLVGLALRIRMLRAQLTRGATDDVTPQLDEAETALRTALAELRDLAHGIFPAVLADEGLAAALETLAESHPTRVRLDALPTERFESPIETAAYIVVAESLERLEPTHARVRAARAGSQLVVEVEMDGNVAEPLTHLEDRIGALDGRLSVVAAGGRLRLRAEVPCA